MVAAPARRAKKKRIFEDVFLDGEDGGDDNVEQDVLISVSWAESSGRSIRGRLGPAFWLCDGSLPVATFTSATEQVVIHLEPRQPVGASGCA